MISIEPPCINAGVWASNDADTFAMQDDWVDRASSPGGIPADEAAWWDAGSADEGDLDDAEGEEGAPPASGAKRLASKRAVSAARCAAGC